MPNKRNAFTLVELLVVIGIITILAGLLLPALQRAIYEAKIVSDVNNHKQIAVGVIAYTSDNNDYYPTTKNVGWRQGPWEAVRGSSNDYRADLIEYFGGSVSGVWTCPLATYDWGGNGNFRKGGGENGADLDDMTLAETRISYSFFFGRTGGPDAWSVWDKPIGGGCEVTPVRGMLKVGQPMVFNTSLTGSHRILLGNGTGETSGSADFHVLSSDVYVRYHHGFWRFAHQGFGSNSLVNRQRFGNTGFSEAQSFSQNTPGVAFWDCPYAKDDGSASVLREMTAYDERGARNNDFFIPNPDK